MKWKKEKKSMVSNEQRRGSSVGKQFTSFFTASGSVYLIIINTSGPWTTLNAIVKMFKLLCLLCRTKFPGQTKWQSKPPEIALFSILNRWNREMVCDERLKWCACFQRKFGTFQMRQTFKWMQATTLLLGLL